MVDYVTLNKAAQLIFQYSLCRVVLMVRYSTEQRRKQRNFQYSLCRVVLMVVMTASSFILSIRLSVLALSSRFDGLLTRPATVNRRGLSVLALSSRFDGRMVQPLHRRHHPSFSTRSVESF